MDAEEHYLEQFKLKRLIKKLKNADGNGTSLISLVIPANKKVSDYQQMLTEEMGKAEQIKDRQNRQSVITALVSAKEILKNYKGNTRKGLCVYCGNVAMQKTNTIKKLKICFEPFIKITAKLYNCGDHFDTTPLERLVESNESYGFVIVDGSGCLMAKVQGNTKTILNKFSVDLPKKHHKGGQSSNRFANIRAEKRLIYTKKVCEEVKKTFITANKPNVDGLVMAGYADFKTRVYENNIFDGRLKPIVIKVVDISYGMEQGLNQAIALAQDSIQNVRLVQEQQMIKKFMEHIDLDTGLVAFGVNETMKCLHDLAVETLIVYEDLDMQIVDLIPTDPKHGKEVVQKYLPLKDLEYKSTYVDKKEKIEYNIQDYDSLVDDLGEKFRDYKCQIFYVSDLSAEGHQFLHGFSGIGAILKFKTQVDEEYYSDDDYDLDEFI